MAEKRKWKITSPVGGGDEVYQVEAGDYFAAQVEAWNYLLNKYGLGPGCTEWQVGKIEAVVDSEPSEKAGPVQLSLWR